MSSIRLTHKSKLILTSLLFCTKFHLHIPSTYFPISLTFSFFCYDIVNKQLNSLHIYPCCYFHPKDQLETYFISVVNFSCNIFIKPSILTFVFSVHFLEILPPYIYFSFILISIIIILPTLLGLKDFTPH